MTNEQFTLLKIKEIVEKYRNTEIISEKEDFYPDDYAGGNIDDAWWAGISDGEAILAKRILEIIE